MVLSLDFDLKKKNKIKLEKRHVEERRPEDINCGIRFLIFLFIRLNDFILKIMRFKRESKDWLLFVRTGASLFLFTITAFFDGVVSAYKLLTVEGLLVLVFLQDDGAKFLDDAFFDEQFGLVMLF